MKGLLTIDSLFNLLVSQGKNFDFKNSTEPIIVQTLADYSEAENSSDGLLHVIIKACHCLLNRNNSYISEANMKKAIPSIYNIPILANIIDLDSGEKDFHSHDFTINEKTGEVHYIERPVGVIPESGNAHLEYDEEMDKTYVVVNGLIYEDYGNEAADIIRKKGTNKVSVELEIYDLSFNAKDKYLEINEFAFRGITLLGKSPDGKEIQEGMQGSKLSLTDFSESNNSLVHYSKRLDELDEKINILIDKYAKEGERTKMTKFEELLQQYGVTTEEVDFDYENLSDEELEAAFAEAFKKDEAKETSTEEVNMCKSFSVEFNGKKHTFEVSLDEVIYALETVVNDTYAEADNAYYGLKVYEKYVVMVDYYTGRAYKQSYKKKNGSYSLSGDRVEVYARYLTHEEEKALDEMRGKYEAAKAQLNEYISKENAAKKEAILNSEDYSSISESEEFKEFSADVTADGNEDAYSVEDVQKKCDELLLAHAKSEATAFSATKKKDNKQRKIKTGIRENDYKPYGSLFD